MVGLRMGLWGFSGAGKSTLAGFLAEDHAYAIGETGHLVRAFLAACGQPVPEDKRRESPWLTMQQCIGEALGQTFGRDLLVRTLLARNPGNLVLPGLRRREEFELVKEWDEWAGGLAVRVDRPGLAPANLHSLEVGLQAYAWDAVIVNDGTLADLRRKASALVRWAEKHVWGGTPGTGDALGSSPPRRPGRLPGDPPEVF